MGLTTKTPLKEIMRRTILVLSLAIIYATASPMAEDHIIPEESLFALDDDLSEAQQKVNEMTAAGKSDKDCRKLVTETRKDIETNVNTCQKSMDRRFWQACGAPPTESRLGGVPVQQQKLCGYLDFNRRQDMEELWLLGGLPSVVCKYRMPINALPSRK